MGKIKNNQGLTLVELIVVIAIISVITGMTTLGISFLTNSRVKKAYSELLSSYSEARLNTMSKTNASDLKLTFDDGKYYVEIGNQGRSEILSNPYSISYFDSNNVEHNIDASNPSLTISFYRATGGIKPISAGVYVEKINVSGKQVQIVPDSGKYREV